MGRINLIASSVRKHSHGTVRRRDETSSPKEGTIRFHSAASIQVESHTFTVTFPLSGELAFATSIRIDRRGARPPGNTIATDFACRSNRVASLGPKGAQDALIQTGDSDKYLATNYLPVFEPFTGLVC